MYWSYTLDGLIVTVLLLCLTPCPSYPDVSKNWAVRPGEFPFLVLVDIQSSSGGPSQLVNGALASLSCALTLSTSLAQLPSGHPGPYLHLRVYAGLTDLSQLASSPYRDVIKITNELKGNDNKYFPNLVILQLETPFQGSSLIRPVVFNVGMLSPRSMVVGWAHLPASNNATLSHAVAIYVIPRTSTRCNNWRLVEFPEQMCCFGFEPHPLRLSEGALLVDQDYLTAIKQFDTYLQSQRSTPIALFVRISYFMPWIQNVVLDPVPEEIFLKTNFVDDDITLKPRQDRSSMGSPVNQCNYWQCFLLAEVVFTVVFIQ